MNERIKVIVFDLDGTLYQDFTVHKQYLHFMVEGTDKEPWEHALVDFTEEVLRGNRLKMNAFYRMDAVGANEPKRYFKEVERALLPVETAAPGEERIYLGDVWAVLTLIGYSLGLYDPERCQTIYRRTRAAMEESGMTGNKRLGDAIRRANACCETILLSNSDEKTALNMLDRLGFSGLFQTIGFSAGKPFGMVDKLKSCCPAGLENPGSILAVGDHAYNDLEPLRKIGCRTLWMNPYPGIHEPQYDLSLRTLDELADYINSLCS